MPYRSSPEIPRSTRFRRREFAEYHKSLRVAVAHIELLLKLAAMVMEFSAPVSSGNDRILLATLMREAEGEIQDLSCEVRGRR